jgi:hypothetical protein
MMYCECALFLALSRAFLSYYLCTLKSPSCSILHFSLSGESTKSHNKESDDSLIRIRSSSQQFSEELRIVQDNKYDDGTVQDGSHLLPILRRASSAGLVAIKGAPQSTKTELYSIRTSDGSSGWDIFQFCGVIFLHGRRKIQYFRGGGQRRR